MELGAEDACVQAGCRHQLGVCSHCFDPAVLQHDDQISDGGAELQPVETATTVRHGGDGVVVVDGPFSEAKEVIGGFSVLDVPDLDAAIAVVREWPMLRRPGTSVEIRPMVTDYSQFES